MSFKKARACQHTGIGLALALVQLPVHAAEWTNSAGVAPAVEYTDNLCLSADDEQGQWIGKVTPDVSITGSGRRANVRVNAAVELNSLSDGDLEECPGGGRRGDREQFAPTVDAAADAELIQNWFYIDATASADQNRVSSFAAGGDSLDRNGNTNTTYRYSVSPYIQRRFKDVADMTLRYTYDEEYSSKDIVGDSTENSAQALLAGGALFSPWSWSLQGDYSKVDYSDNPRNEFEQVNNNDSELKSAQFNLGYQINRAWQANGYYGQEWNDFVSSQEDIDGDFWDAGLRWTPNARTTIEAGLGDRFYGTTYRGSINHRHKRSVLTASYSEDLTYDRDIRGLDDPLPGGPSGGGGNSTTLSNSPTLDKRFTLGYSYAGQRTNLGVSASYSDQTRADAEPLTGLEESTFTDISLSASRELSRQLSISAGVSWREDKPKNADTEFLDTSETWRANLGVARQLNQNISLSFDYRYEDRQSDSDAVSGTVFDEYTENRFTLTLRIGL